MDINIRGADADMVGALVLLEYFCVVLLWVTSVSCALGPNCIGVLCRASTDVVFSPDCIGIWCSA